MKIGLLFGSFNPVHIGHLLLATRLREHAGLDEVWLVVSPHNPHKSVEGLAPEDDRLRMVELALKDHSCLKACAIEFGLPRPSYTYQTLDALRAGYPKYEFTLLIGGDNLEKLHTWKNYEHIRALVKILAYARSGGAADHPDAAIVQLPLVDLSATEIRERVSRGLSIRYFVPEQVEAYIQAKQLYR